MNEKVKTGDRILDTIINTNDAAIIIPPGLVVQFTELVAAYSAQHGETPWDCCRAVEIGVLQLGIRAMRETLSENKKLGERMGWPKEEEVGA